MFLWPLDVVLCALKRREVSQQTLGSGRVRTPEQLYWEASEGYDALAAKLSDRLVRSHRLFRCIGTRVVCVAAVADVAAVDIRGMRGGRRSVSAVSGVCHTASAVSCGPLSHSVSRVVWAVGPESFRLPFPHG